SRPRLLVARVAKPAVKIDHRFPILPNRHRGAQFAELFEVFLEQRFQSLKKRTALQLHCGIVGHRIMASDTDAPTAIALPVLRADARTNATCSRWAQVSSCPRPPPSVPPAETSIRPSAKN